MPAGQRPTFATGKQIEIIDYNGTGKWSLDAIQKRYAIYAHQLKVPLPIDLRPKQHEERGRQWIYPVMFEVIKGIERGDQACIELGIEFIEEDARFPFGRIIKSKAAKALRRSILTSEQKERVRNRVAHMLIAEHVPREYREYAKLFRKVGMGRWWSFIEEGANRNNPYVMRHFHYFRQYVREE